MEYLRYSTTSAYSSTSLPAWLECPSSSHPTARKDYTAETALNKVPLYSICYGFDPIKPGNTRIGTVGLGRADRDPGWGPKLRRDGGLLPPIIPSHQDIIDGGSIGPPPAVEERRPLLGGLLSAGRRRGEGEQPSQECGHRPRAVRSTLAFRAVSPEKWISGTKTPFPRCPASFHLAPYSRMSVTGTIPCSFNASRRFSASFALLTFRCNLGAD
jgi:hypothetical protein